jgi:hypothetical protein
MIKPITRKEFARHERMIREALRLASTHDPDLVREIKDHARWLVQLGTELGNRLDVVERQLERIGAPQYRVIHKGLRVRAKSK